MKRNHAVGAEVSDQGVSFRVWAPDRQRVVVYIEDSNQRIALNPEQGGYFSALAPEVAAGTRYRIALDDDDHRYPDPASHFQPEGPHGPSQVIDHRHFPWTDQSWRGLTRRGQVLYEMHVGTFTSEGTWRAATERLPELADLGITAVEVMPLADFSGDFGWGYDGVNPFAPSRLYGEPDDVRRFINTAHQLGIGVILDVVYNHLGPDGNYLGTFGKDFFTDRYETDWGAAINFDGPQSHGARDYFISNATYWVRDFHFDGLRLDATQSIFDRSRKHILAEIVKAARAAAGERSIVVYAENEPQLVKHVLPIQQKGYGLDGLWNDDFHHANSVALNGRNEAYFTDYEGKPQELINAAKWGFLYQGQFYTWQKKGRGTPSQNVAPECFVTFLDNHDQVANSGRGTRCHQGTHPALHRALTAYWLLGPWTPMFFQGQEFASNSPFYYFASHRPDLAKMVADGRKDFLRQFPSMADEEMSRLIPDPASPETFRVCKLDWAERTKHHEMLDLHRDLLKLRREDPVLRRQSGELDGAPLRGEAFVLRYFDEGNDDRLLLVNLGVDVRLAPLPEPLMAEPTGREWKLMWSSESPRYGGNGTPKLKNKGVWCLPGKSTMFLIAQKRGQG